MMFTMRAVDWVGVVGLILGLVGCGHSVEPGKAPALNEGWVSSGGELLKDAQNSWWIRNTKLVEFCVEVDPTSISLSADAAHRLVHEALTYWKKEFSEQKSFFKVPSRAIGATNNRGFVFVPEESPLNPLGIATQEFVESPCARAKLKFQFGDGNLTDAQKEFVKNKKYVGAAIRTAYDPTQLVGQGVILIAPDRGAHRFSSVDDVWLNELWTLSVLVHELGHVFGIAHTGNRFSLMSERFPESLVTFSLGYPNGPQTATHKHIASFFHPPTSGQVTCLPELKAAWNYFGVVPPAPQVVNGAEILQNQCFGLSLEETTRHFKLTRTDQARTKPPETLGEISVDKFEFDYHPVVTFEVPAEQKVFGPTDLEHNLAFIYGAYVFDSAFGAGTFTSTTGKKKPIAIHFGGPGLWGFRLTGQEGEKMIPLTGSHNMSF
jgi:hypothetical protein